MHTFANNNRRSDVKINSDTKSNTSHFTFFFSLTMFMFINTDVIKLFNEKLIIESLK